MNSDKTMTQKDNILDSVLGIIGILSLVAIAIHTYKSISKRTETSVISDEALKALNDKDKALELREVVEEYHSTGKWNKSKLETIL